MSTDPAADRDPEQRLREFADSWRYRGTTLGSDIHVLLADCARRGAAVERVRALADDPSAWAYTDGPSAEDIYRALDGATVNAELKVDRAREHPDDRLDLSGRDPATIRPIELLAFAYPDVYALVKRHTKIAEMWRSVRMVDEATGSPFRGNWPGLAAELDRLVDPDQPEPR